MSSAKPDLRRHTAIFVAELIGVAAATYWLWDSWDSITQHRRVIATIIFILLVSCVGYWARVVRAAR